MEVFEIPSVETRTREVRRLRPRRGVFGKIAQLFAGEKEYTDTEEIIDTRQRDEALAMRSEHLADVEACRSAISAEMEQYHKPEVSSSALEAEIAEYRERLTELRSDYVEAVQRHEKKIEQDAARMMKRIQREIKDYAEERGEEFARGVGAALKEMEQQSYEAVRGMIVGRVGDQIRTLEERLNQLIADSQASDAERDEKLQRSEAARELASDLMSRSAAFEVEIQQEMTDVIKGA